MNIKFFFSVLCLCFSITESHGIPLLTTVTKNDSFVLRNPRNQLATDIQISLVPPAGGQEIGGGSSGGSAFGRTTLAPCCFVNFFVGSGPNAGTGVAGNASITLNISGFDIGTNFSADFSYRQAGSINIEFEEGILVSQGVFEPQFPQGPLGNDLLVQVVPEPATLYLYLLILGLVGIGLRSSRRSSLQK